MEAGRPIFQGRASWSPGPGNREKGQGRRGWTLNRKSWSLGLYNEIKRDLVVMSWQVRCSHKEDEGGAWYKGPRGTPITGPLTRGPSGAVLRCAWIPTFFQSTRAVARMLRALRRPMKQKNRSFLGDCGGSR